MGRRGDGRLPKRAGGYSLDLDSTVFERYGEQEGVKRGYNPRKPGRGSHHPLLVGLDVAGQMLAEFSIEFLGRAGIGEWGG